MPSLLAKMTQPPKAPMDWKRRSNVGAAVTTKGPRRSSSRLNSACVMRTGLTRREGSKPCTTADLLHEAATNDFAAAPRDKAAATVAS